jgi:transposase InsO family protein
MLVKPQPAPSILSQESDHTTLSITHHTRKRPSTGPRTTHGPQVENQRGKKIKTLQLNRGGEYLSHEFSSHLKSCETVPQLTPPGTPRRNGVSEQRNRTLLDMIRSMMSQSDLPLSF